MRLEIVFAALLVAAMLGAWLMPDLRMACLIAAGLIALAYLGLWLIAAVLDISEDPY